MRYPIVFATLIGVFAMGVGVPAGRAYEVSPSNYETVKTEGGLKTVRGYSEAHKIDRILPSMFGPTGDQKVVLESPADRKVLWMTGACGQALLVHVRRVTVRSPFPAPPLGFDLGIWIPKTLK